MDYIGRSQDVSEVVAVEEMIHNQPTAVDEEKVVRHPTHVEIIGGHVVTRREGSRAGTNMQATTESAEWRTGLLCCWEGGMGTCLYGFCCPPCATASARTRFDGSDWWMNLFFLNPYHAYQIIREGYSIETDPCCEPWRCQCDICRGFFCMPCIVVQMLNEVKGRDATGPELHRQLYRGGHNHWIYGLWGCCNNMETCPFICLAGLIPVFDVPALMGVNAAALDKNNDRFRYSDKPETCWEWCCDYNGWCFNWCCVNPVILRNIIRESHGIGGCCAGWRCLNIIFEDVLPTWFCYWCTTCQNYNEVIAKDMEDELEKEPTFGFLL